MRNFNIIIGGIINTAETRTCAKKLAEEFLEKMGGTLVSKSEFLDLKSLEKCDYVIYDDFQSMGFNLHLSNLRNGLFLDSHAHKVTFITAVGPDQMSLGYIFDHLIGNRSYFLSNEVFAYSPTQDFWGVLRSAILPTGKRFDELQEILDHICAKGKRVEALQMKFPNMTTETENKE